MEYYPHLQPSEHMLIVLKFLATEGLQPDLESLSPLLVLALGNSFISGVQPKWHWWVWCLALQKPKKHSHVNLSSFVFKLTCVLMHVCVSVLTYLYVHRCIVMYVFGNIFIHVYTCVCMCHLCVWVYSCLCAHAPVCDVCMWVYLL